MVEPKTPPRDDAAKREKPADAPRDGAKSQRDDARDEGAGKMSVPIEDVTTANDK